MSHRRRVGDDEARHLHCKVVSDVAVDHPGPGVVEADTHKGPAARALALLAYVLGCNPVILAVGKEGDHVPQGRVLEIQQALRVGQFEGGAADMRIRDDYDDALGLWGLFL